MTKKELLSLLYLPVLGLLFAIRFPIGSGSLFKTGPDLYPAFWFPVLFFAFCFWLNRGFTSRWIDFSEDGIISSRRPMALRLLAGLVAAVFVVPMVWLCEDISWPLTFEEFLGLFFAILTLVGVAALFLFLAGPQVVRFDCHQRAWQRTQGFPLLCWTALGDTNECILILRYSGSRGTYYYRLELQRPKGWPITIGMYEEREAARAEAKRVGHLLQMPIDDRTR